MYRRRNNSTINRKDSTMDKNILKLSDLLINYSTHLKPGENILIEYEGECCLPLVKQLIRDAYAAGAKPFVKITDNRITKEILSSCDENQLKLMDDNFLNQLKDMHAYIAIRAPKNTAELSSVTGEKMNLYNKMTSPSLEYRVNNLKWCILRYPNDSMAQLAGMGIDEFTDFYFNVCTMDYGKMSNAMDNLKTLMDRTDEVRLKGPELDLTFSIKGIGAVKCDGKANIPDGEVYTAPVRDSMNGYITYNTPSEIEGFTYENVHFEIENGKIVKATANDTDRINAYLNTDEGARYFGEFAIGVNPFVREPMKDILFDEKICGSFHLTPGMCYEDAPNGNSSAVHWDLVMIQRPEYGGGEIYFDGKLIRKDGIFVIPELECLNPKNLK